MNHLSLFTGIGTSERVAKFWGPEWSFRWRETVHLMLIHSKPRRKQVLVRIFVKKNVCIINISTYWLFQHFPFKHSNDENFIRYETTSLQKPTGLAGTRRPLLLSLPASLLGAGLAEARSHEGEARLNLQLIRTIPSRKKKHQLGFNRRNGYIMLYLYKWF